MSKILELREKRAKAWEAAKAFLDTHSDKNGLLSAENTATYDKMEADISAYDQAVGRLERQAVIDLEMAAATSAPITGRPTVPGGEEKTGRAADEYKSSFWRTMRDKGVPFDVQNALKIGTDGDGGYLVPDEYERTLVAALEEENIFRTMAKVITTSSGDRKIPVAATKGTASWIDEEGAIPESDDKFGQVSIGAYKLGTMIKVSEELLTDSVFNLEWRCNSKYKKGCTCQTPHLYETAIQKAFVDAFNTLYAHREQLLEDYAIIISLLTDTATLDTEAAAQQTECDITMELIRKCVEENTRAATDQDKYQRRYEALVARYEAAMKRLGEVAEERQTRAAKRELISRFMDDLARIGGPLAEFDEGLWCETVEAVTVNSESDVVFSFRDGSTIHVDARTK